MLRYLSERSWPEIRMCLTAQHFADFELSTNSRSIVAYSTFTTLTMSTPSSQSSPGYLWVLSDPGEAATLEEFQGECDTLYLCSFFDRRIAS